ncbi:MAG: sigma 54-interacting transcriptional regulator [Thermodesulfobacteriota bacterium]|nr:sigma 54-interacting transcriptional regulator [Thermodesulfobacteriota bacterium]
MYLGDYWKTIFDTLHDGLVVVDTAGRILAANAAAEHITGYAAEELEGATCQILNCTGCKFEGKGRGEQWCRMFAAGTVRDKKCQITKKDRRTIHILKSARVLRDDTGEMIGAVETLTDISQIIRQQKEIDTLRQTYQLDQGFYGILGKSPVMINLFEMIDNVARSEAPVMISGESGTGKEMVARALHKAGHRRNKPFIKVNCAALNESLLESELFGHVKGAFTGADRDRIGRFEAAHEGTILLDEIGDIAPSIQVKLLRVLEEKKIERVGDHHQLPIDARIVTATNKNLEQLVRESRFREDLYFRINVFPVHCPRLADRMEDIPMLVRHFIHRNMANGDKKISGVTPAVLKHLTTYDWPGNIRELRNAIEYAFVLCPGGTIDVTHLPARITGGGAPVTEKAQTVEPRGDRDRLEHTLRQTGWNQSETARRLNISRVTVWKKIRKYGIQRPWEQ